jgi:hypothetical protein
VNLVIDAVGNKYGGLTVLPEVPHAAAALGGIRQVSLLASPVAVRGFTMLDCEKIRVVDVASAESGSARFFWAWRGLDQRLAQFECDAFLGLNGIGGVRRTCASLVFIQQPVPYSRDSLRRKTEAIWPVLDGSVGIAEHV